MRALIYFFIMIIDVVAVIDILKGNKDFGKKLIWIVAVIFLPVLGPLLYYFVGRK